MRWLLLSGRYLNNGRFLYMKTPTSCDTGGRFCSVRRVSLLPTAARCGFVGRKGLKRFADHERIPIPGGAVILQLLYGRVVHKVQVWADMEDDTLCSGRNVL